MFWNDRNEKYEGEWQDDKQNGFGTHTWLDAGGEFKQV